MNMQATRHWLKNSPSPIARGLFQVIKGALQASMPAPKLIVVPLYKLTKLVSAIWENLTRALWWTPVFKGRLQHVGRGLYLYGGMPFVSGPVSISMGDNCRVSGQSTFSGRTCSAEQPELIIGSNIDIGWQTTIAVGSKVVIGDNVRIAGRAFIAGYPGHPLNAEDRAAGLPELDSQVGDVILERDVWLATGVSVMAGVTIGQGTIVAAGSVVTNSLPPFVVAGGVPAKVIRPLTDEEMKR
ncbi:Galactoside O-acetyltransferase [Grimontia celer]|uniref:Galactoside O-acetyltransferase n=1 Tax=Grimontia celer TaxID=1796497 RepID=A0A128F2V7_9GAMM|nr:acyltransferase [Grimontia celer]CZF81138.1 Galactoside O-acetyltransferase [Grimontia celer]